jgi:hypothetical protein
MLKIKKVRSFDIGKMGEVGRLLSFFALTPHLQTKPNYDDYL